MANKTPHMHQLERWEGLSIEQLIQDGTVREAALRLGIHYSTIAKWRHRLNLQLKDGQGETTT